MSIAISLWLDLQKQMWLQGSITSNTLKKYHWIQLHIFFLDKMWKAVGSNPILNYQIKYEKIGVSDLKLWYIPTWSREVHCADRYTILRKLGFLYFPSPYRAFRPISKGIYLYFIMCLLYHWLRVSVEKWVRFNTHWICRRIVRAKRVKKYTTRMGQ